MAYPLDPTLLKQYDSDGYLIARQLLSPSDAAAIKRAVEEVLTAPAERRVGNFHEEAAAATGEKLDERSRYRKLGQFGRHSPVVWAHAYGHPNVLDVCRHFLGVDVVLLYDSVFLKPAKHGGATPWHQDIALWPDKHHNALNMWIAIDPATRENGCLQFAPGTHKGPVIEHINRGGVHGELPPERLECARVEPVELSPGDAVFWHSNLWHYSGPNESSRDRCAVASVTLSRRDAEQARSRGTLAWLMRGGERAPFPLVKFDQQAASSGPAY